MKKRKKKDAPTISVDVSAELVDRVIFLARVLGFGDTRQVFEAALSFYDRAVCARLDGARIEVIHRTCQRELLDPCKSSESTSSR